MCLDLRYRSDIDLRQPAMQVEIRNHIARCLRDHPDGDEGVITLAGVDHRFMYVHDDVVDTVIGPPDYIEEIVSERRQIAHEAQSPLPPEEHKHPVLAASPAPLLRSAPLPLREIGAGGRTWVVALPAIVFHSVGSPAFSSD